MLFIFFIFFVNLCYSQTCTGNQIQTIVVTDGIPSLQCSDYSTDNCADGKIGADGKCTECKEGFRLTNSGCVAFGT